MPSRGVLVSDFMRGVVDVAMRAYSSSYRSNPCSLEDVSVGFEVGDRVEVQVSTQHVTAVLISISVGRHRCGMLEMLDASG